MHGVHGISMAAFQLDLDDEPTGNGYLQFHIVEFPLYRDCERKV